MPPRKKPLAETPRTRTSPRRGGTSSAFAAASALTSLNVAGSASTRAHDSVTTTLLFPHTPLILPPLPPGPSTTNRLDSNDGNPDLHDQDDVPPPDLAQGDKSNYYLSSPSHSIDSDKDDIEIDHSQGDIADTFDQTFDSNDDEDDDEYDDGNRNDYAADKWEFNKRVHHYMEYSEISTRNVRAVEYVCMTQANTIVCNNSTKGKAVVDDLMLKEYLKLVHDIPDAYFVNHTIKAGMLDGYTGMRGGKTVNPQTGKKPPIAATPFARKQKKVVAKVRLAG